MAISSSPPNQRSKHRIGNLDEKHALRAGLNEGSTYRLADTKRDFSW